VSAATYLSRYVGPAALRAADRFVADLIGADSWDREPLRVGTRLHGLHAWAAEQVAAGWSRERIEAELVEILREALCDVETGPY